MFWIFFNPFWWISFLGQAFRWWLACEIFSIAVLPICFFIFPAMKDRGWGFAKIFGILFITWINWYLCIFLKFSALSVFIAFLIALVVSGICFSRVKSRLIAFIKKRWRLILLYEILFLFAFLFFVNIRSYCPEAMFNPDYSGAEKLMNCNYLHALMRTEHFPPRDTWLWGNDLLTNKPFYINYYYFGHLMWATLAKFSLYEARYAFNLGLATIFALTFIGSFALGFNLTRRLRWGFLAAFMVAFFGNIDALQQTFERVGFWMGRHSANQSAWSVVMSHVREAFLSVDFWRTSRIMDNTVTEFPYFSAILGDLHPHHSSLPIVLLAIGAGMSLIMRMPARVSSPLDSIKKNGWTLLFLALVICGAFAANTWDAIVLGFFATVLIFYMNMRWWGNSLKGVGMTMLMVGGLGLSALCLALLFKLYFVSPIKNEIKIASFFPLKFEKIKLMIVPLKPEMRAELSDYFVLLGLFLFPVIIYLWGLFRTYLKKFDPSMRTLWVFTFAFLIVISWNVWHFWLPGLALAWLVATIALLMDKRWGRRTIYFLLVSIPVIFFTLFVDTFYFDDRMVGVNERYNTLFKIYYPLWEFIALGAVYAFARMFRAVWIGRRWQSLCGLSLFLLGTFIVGMLYPIQATGVRTLFFHTSRYLDDQKEKPVRTLDSTAYMNSEMTHRINIGNAKKTLTFKDDAGIIEWIRQNVKGQPVVLEAIGGCYVPFSRVASMTGLPTLVGWSHHIAQHHGDDIYKSMGPRETDAGLIYTSSSIEKRKELLAKYSIRYVMVGVLEREKYTKEQLVVFDGFLKPVFTSGQSILYEVPEEMIKK